VLHNVGRITDIEILRISNNSNILPDLVRLTLFIRGPWNLMADRLDESIKEKYRQYFVNDTLMFMKDAIDWNAFPYLLKGIYHKDGEDSLSPVSIYLI